VFGHNLAFLVRLEVCSTSQLELSREILSLFLCCCYRTKVL
jgi:hypothetical protein